MCLNIYFGMVITTVYNREVFAGAPSFKYIVNYTVLQSMQCPVLINGALDFKGCQSAVEICLKTPSGAIVSCAML